MKGKITVWYLILIALGVITMITMMLMSEKIIEDSFINALEIAFD